MPVTPFVITCNGRDGSTFTGTSLDQHPNIVTKEELLISNKKEQHEQAGSATAFLHQQLYGCEYPSEIQAVGFRLKWFHGQEPPLNDARNYLHQLNVKVIHVQRRNYLKNYLSGLIADQTNVWVDYSGNKLSSIQVTIDPQKAINYFQHQSKRYEQNQNDFKQHESITVTVMIKLSGGGEQPVLLPHSDYKSGIRSGKWIRTAADKGKNVDLKANPYFERPYVFNSVNLWLAEAAGILRSKVNQISPASPSRKPQSFGELLLQEILMKSCSMVDLVFEQKKPCSSLISLLGMGKQEVLAVKQIIESLFLGGTKVFNNVGEGVLKAFKSLTGKPPGVFKILAEAFMELIGLNTNSVSQFTSLLSAVWSAATSGTTKAWKGAISAGKDFFGLSTENLMNWALEVIPSSFKGAAKFVVSGFEALISGDFGSWLSGSVAKGIDQIKTTFESLLDTIPDKIKGFLFDAIIDRLPKLIGEYVVKLVGGPAGWVVGLADMLMGAINFIVGFIKKGVFQKIAAMIKRVQGGAGVGFVMQEILGMLPMLASIALRFLARITGADDVISAIASVFGNISSALHDLFVAAIRTIWNLIKKLFGAIRTWLFPPATSGNVTVSVDEDKTVVVARSPEVPYNPNNEPHECNLLKDKLDTATNVFKADPSNTNKTKAVAAEQKLADCLNDNGAVGGNYCAAMNYTHVTNAPGGGSWTDYITKNGPGGKDITGITAKEFNDGNDNARIHGHHVVMKKRFSDVTGPSREILCKHRINPYIGLENLSFSPLNCHSRLYAEKVYAELKAAENDGPSAVKRVLVTMAEQHRNCDFGTNGTVDPKTDE